MSKAVNGGPAFPVDTRSTGNDDETGNFGHQTGPSTWQYGGMTLRDYFAARAPVFIADAMDACFGSRTNFGSLDRDARLCVLAKLAEMRGEYADAMLRERAK